MKRIANLLDSQQPEPPTVVEVEKTPRTMVTAPSDTVDALLGHIEDDEGKQKDMNKHYKTAVKAFLEYLDVCAANNVSYETLDECFVGRPPDFRAPKPWTYPGSVYNFCPISRAA